MSSVKTSMAGLVRVHARQLPNNKSESKGGEDSMEALWMYLKIFEDLKLQPVT